MARLLPQINGTYGPFYGQALYFILSLSTVLLVLAVYFYPVTHDKIFASLLLRSLPRSVSPSVSLPHPISLIAISQPGGQTHRMSA